MEVLPAEGDYFFFPARGFLFRTFKGVLSLPLREFLKIEWKDQSFGSLNKEIRDCVAWEDYLEKYPNSPFAITADSEYRSSLYFVLFSFTDNDGAQRCEAVAAKEFAVRKYPNHPCTRRIVAYFNLLVESNFERTEKTDDLLYDYGPKKGDWYGTVFPRIDNYCTR